MNCGSVLSLQLRTRCGFSPNARQMRDTAVCDRPVAAAIDRVDQCVSWPGPCSKVLVMTSSIFSSVTVRGRPGRGSSDGAQRRQRPRNLGQQPSGMP
jgi:hypothetical protein